MILPLSLALTMLSPNVSEQTAAICALGAAILSVDSEVAIKQGNDMYFYVGEDRPFGINSNIFHACPALALALPPKLHIADAEIMARAASIQSAHPANVAWVETPVFDADMRGAEVTYGQKCTGLCGIILKARYVFKGQRWQMAGPAQLVAVS